MPAEFSDVISSEQQLRQIIGGNPSKQVANKITTRLDRDCRAFISQSPFLLIASADAQGYMDLSPKGDPAGFVKVLNDTTLAIPDRPGNRRADTFSNILQNPKIGLFFLVPGRRETLRITGMALIVRDEALRQSMALHGKTPEFAIVVTIEEAFFYCSKSIARSKIWQSEHWLDLTDIPLLNETAVAAEELEESLS